MRWMSLRLARSLSLFLFCRAAGAVMACLLAMAVWCTARPVDAAPAEHVVMISLDGMPAYLVGDPKVSMPNLHALAKRGVRTAGMRVSNPSVTWPNHTTLVTGMQPRRHGVLANGVLVRGGPGVPVTIDPRRDKSELVRTPTLFDVVHAAGMTTAAIQWPCTRSAPTIDDDFQEFFHPYGLRYTTPRFLAEMIEDGILPKDPEATYRTHGYPWFDYTWTSAACNLIAKHKPNLLLLHLLNTDTTHHQYGPQTQAGYTAVAYADTCVARVLAAIDAAGIGEKTAVFIVSDHGFTTTEKALLPNTLLRQEGWLRTNGSSKIEEARVSVVPEGGVALVYVTDPTIDAAGRQKVRDLFIGREGIASVIEPDRFAEFGLPDVRDWPQMADMVLVAEDGYNFSAKADDERFVAPSAQVGAYLGSHGFIATNPKMNALCIAAGAGIKSGVELDVIDNIDVAPTVAHLLGVQLPDTDGKIMAGALTVAP
ncbi:MAG TPA: alkaline phosphatase family protein [Pirellulales bacterium]|jgi:predicted AlkP superfamily pyrophosphatase or phosphodiesterase|nr:alkaline phosphatase family protein [Pirellulales bacterium]